MPIPVDPDLGFVEFSFPVPPGEDGVAKPDVVADVDVYYATELMTSVQARYFKELEDAGLQAEATRHESLRRWLTVLFKRTPAVDVDALSFRAMAGIQAAILAEVERLEKKGPGSSSPA